MCVGLGRGFKAMGGKGLWEGGEGVEKVKRVLGY
jgi:hypothetical protein